MRLGDGGGEESKNKNACLQTLCNHQTPPNLLRLVTFPASFVTACVCVTVLKNLPTHIVLTTEKKLFVFVQSPIQVIIQYLKDMVSSSTVAWNEINPLTPKSAIWHIVLLLGQYLAN